MKLLFVSLFFCLTATAQFKYPTNREVYDFCVGDTFLYNSYQNRIINPNASPPNEIFLYVRRMNVILDKKILKDTILYRTMSISISYRNPYYSTYDIYSNSNDRGMVLDLDSMILEPYPQNWYANKYYRIDTTYPWKYDTTKTVYCKKDNGMEGSSIKEIIPSLGMTLYNVVDFSQCPINNPGYFELIYFSRNCENKSYNYGDKSALAEFLITSAIHKVNSRFKMYPNPISTYLKIENPDKYKLVIKDIHLKTMVEIDEEQTTIQTDDWASGVYLVHIIENNQILETRKIIK